MILRYEANNSLCRISCVVIISNSRPTRICSLTLTKVCSSHFLGEYNSSPFLIGLPDNLQGHIPIVCAYELLAVIKTADFVRAKVLSAQRLAMGKFYPNVSTTCCLFVCPGEAFSYSA